MSVSNCKCAVPLPLPPHVSQITAPNNHQRCWQKKKFLFFMKVLSEGGCPWTFIFLLSLLRYLRHASASFYQDWESCQRSFLLSCSAPIQFDFSKKTYFYISNFFF